MNLSRRVFLRGILTVSVVSILPTGLFRPKIFADGIHDDADGLNALFSGQPFDLIGDKCQLLTGPDVYINGGEFLIGKGLKVSNKRIVRMRNFLIKTSTAFPDDDAMLDATTGAEIHLDDGTFDLGRGFGWRAF